MICRFYEQFVTIRADSQSKLQHFTDKINKTLDVLLTLLV